MLSPPFTVYFHKYVLTYAKGILEFHKDLHTFPHWQNKKKKKNREKKERNIPAGLFSLALLGQYVSSCLCRVISYQ